jgi:hypothetical protein
MTLPKAISDAIEALREQCDFIEPDPAPHVAALKRAIADHVSPVAPTEAEIEAWKEQAVALMRRAAAAKPVYSATGRAFQLHSADWHGSQDEMPKSVLVYGSGDMGRGEFANYLRADVARETAATPAPKDDTMTQRLTDDRLQALRLMLQEHAASWLHTIDRDTLAAMLDEIEERRRIPQFLRLARAARRCLDGSEVDGWHTPMREVDVVDLREALGELEREA